MKTKLLLLHFLLPLFLFAQVTQIGADIDGEAAGDLSGWKLNLSADGSIVAIGAFNNDGNGSNSGHVRVYQNTGSTWTQIGQDIDGEAADDQSGWSVSLSDDGGIVAIGAPGNDGNGNSSGHVRIYQNIGGTWTQIGEDIDGEENGDSSGNSVSLSADGSIVAIGAFWNIGSGGWPGHVRVYQNTGGAWIQIGQDIDGEGAGDQFGKSVRLSADGNIVAISAWYNDGNGTESGHVRIYQYTGGSWTQIGEDIDGEAAYDWSGFEISLSADGSIVAIGGRNNDGNGSNSGHVRVYQNTWGAWTQIGEDIDGEHALEFSGDCVSLSSDGSILAIGAPQHNGINGAKAGQARIYQYTGGNWVQIGLGIDGEAADDRFGTYLSLSADGSIVAIGAFFNDENGNDSGHVRVFDLGISCSAGFSADPDTLCQGDSVAFTDLSISTDSIISWQWSFEGGTPAASSVQNPVITYNNDGEYNVQLIVSNGILTDTLLQTNFIYVNLSPDPIISGSQSVIPNSEEQYQTEENPGNTYEWEVTGGNITSGGASHQVTVMWGDPGEGSLTASEESTAGCSGITNPYLVVIGAVSIEENYPGKVLIYPNPADETLHISIHSDATEEVIINIISIEGKVAYSSNLKASEGENIFRIATTNLPEGIYILKMENCRPVRLIIIH